jgi:hypothetical protein
MRTRSARILMGALLGAVVTSADAHELECQKTAGIVQVDANGRPVVGANGLPVFLAPPTPVLVVGSYPAAIGFDVWVHNLAPATSVVTGVSDPLLETLAGVLSYGDALAPGLSLPVGAAATATYVVTVQDQAQCLALLGGAGAAPVCTDIRENVFTVTHDVGSAECRARVICGPPQPTTCGDGTCNGGETCATCPADCGACPPPPPTCGNGTCDGTETCASCPADCGVCPPPPPTCGNGTCDVATESCLTCPADCGICPPPPICGNGTCEPTETCSSCPADCGSCLPPPLCGNGTCDATETCRTCPSDCGICPPPPTCGNGTCDATETCASCGADCGLCPPPICGNGTCELGEGCSSCPADCGLCEPPYTCGNGTCDATESCDTCPFDCGACTTPTTVSCAASFTYGCGTDICGVCDQITGILGLPDRLDLRDICELRGGQFTVGPCDTSSALSGHCQYTSPATTSLMPVTVAGATVSEYLYPGWTLADAVVTCANTGGTWVP